MVGIFGIVNVTRDSFSDGGRFLQPADAITHARSLLADGADVLDIGAESTHPDSQPVEAAEEIARLEPVVTELLRGGARLSIDTVKPPSCAASTVPARLDSQFRTAGWSSHRSNHHGVCRNRADFCCR